MEISIKQYGVTHTVSTVESDITMDDAIRMFFRCLKSCEYHPKHIDDVLEKMELDGNLSISDRYEN